MNPPEPAEPPLTEANNPSTGDLDLLPTLEMLRRINAEDAGVARAVAAELEALARAVDAIAERMAGGGRLVYIGAGTSGRLGVLDASEAYPTFNAAPGQVVALIAGGEAALTTSVEGAEDDPQAGRADVAAIDLSAADSLVGIAASGRTPYVLGGMQAALERGALVVSLACSRPSPMETLADIAIAPLVGPEVLSGSTRLKAGTAEKMVLNMLSTGVMVRLGKTYGNLMVEVRPTNRKLRDRACRMIQQACGVDFPEAERLLDACQGEVKRAIVACRAGLSPAEAQARLDASGGSIREALGER